MGSATTGHSADSGQTLGSCVGCWKLWRGGEAEVNSMTPEGKPEEDAGKESIFSAKNGSI